MADARVLIPELCAQFYRMGWCTGTGGGLSVRSDDQIFVAPSGVQKERITSDSLFVLDREGNVISPPSDPCLRPSACTPLFMSAYTLRNAGAVIHSHAPEAALVTLLYPGREFRVSRLEMIKGIEGHGYEDTLVIPIIDNTPYEEQLADSMKEAILAYPRSTAVLVRRHGIYIWGKTWQSAKSQAECYHYLFNFILEARKLGIESTVMIPSPRCVLLDIEGTTTSISFVKDTLFPLARSNIRQFLLDHAEEEDIHREYLAICQTLAEESIKSADISEMATHLERWIDEDRKHTSLKYIQGRVWENLYNTGQVKGHLYDDVAPCLEKWRGKGLRIAIYSSGSVQAQRLLFQHSVNGDLTPHIEAYFDTNVGHKQQPSSYLNIAKALQLAPSDILFLSDILGEIQAAASQGFQVGQLYRDSLPQFLPTSSAPIYRHFNEISI